MVVDKLLLLGERNECLIAGAGASAGAGAGGDDRWTLYPGADDRWTLYPTPMMMSHKRWDDRAVACAYGGITQKPLKSDER